MPDLLVEIGVEEIPANVVLPALAQLETGLAEGLAALRLAHGPSRVYGTPRRLAAFVADVAERQAEQQKEIKGPPAAAAFDAQGQPTAAARGFAAKYGLEIEALQIRETDKGRFVFGIVKEPGEPAAAVLPGLLDSLMRSFVFPKTLRWGTREERFARPVRWLVALLGDTVLEWEFAGVRAGRLTRGHRFLGRSAVPIPAPGAYVETLRAEFVLADHHERRERIRQQAQEAAARVGGRPRIDEALLEENNFLVEWPSCLVGRFPERFLALPEAVLVTVMEKHQRYFPIEDETGRLLPFFIIVRNGEGPGEEIIRQGNEKVIVPRLEDAEFYLREDLKTPLPKRLDSLKRMTFMEALGTLYDKTQRLLGLVEWLGEQTGASAEERAIAARAALLSKCDQTTLMIADGKLATLQGVIGGYYAAQAQEPPAVCQAIAEHYLPVRPEDPPPRTPAGRWLALADKMDNLAAAFRLGLIPRGTRDPQGLRRQAQAVLAILQAGAIHLSLPELIRRAITALPEPTPAPKEALEPEAAEAALREFFAARLAALLEEEGLPYDTVRAVLGGFWDDPVELLERARALQRLRETETDFASLVDTATRPANIWRGTGLPEETAVAPDLFAHEAERRLWEACQKAQAEIAAYKKARPVDYEAIWRTLQGLQSPIASIFEAVMINAEDPALRRNRLALMRELDRLYLQLADFREIVQ